jgi:hypothetical protein
MSVSRTDNFDEHLGRGRGLDVDEQQLRDRAQAQLQQEHLTTAITACAHAIAVVDIINESDIIDLVCEDYSLAFDPHALSHEQRQAILTAWRQRCHELQKEWDAR